MPSLHDPEPPAADLWCARPSCTHPYPQHPHGGPCTWWDPVSGGHCGCRGFLYVLPGIPGASTPPRVDHPGYVWDYYPRQPHG